MRIRMCLPAVVAAVLSLASMPLVSGQAKTGTLVAVWAHADDEVPVGPLLARYAREGAQVYVIIATDGSQGGINTSIPRGPELAKVRDAEAHCSAKALGVHPPILLGFPDGALGHYVANPGLLYGLTERLQTELQRLQPDALITWGPDGGTGHPDHRLVSNIVTQLVRAGAPGAPERLFYASIPAEGFVVNAGRGAPPFLVPQDRHFTTRIVFSPSDLDAAHRSMVCHRTQYGDDVVGRIVDSMRRLGEIRLSSLSSTGPSTDLFR